MYDELKKSLRICGHWKSSIGKDGCDGCMYRDAENNVCKSWIPNDNREERIMLDAADAIEELQGQLDGWIEQERKALLKSVPKWIPVTERLPDDGVYVLVRYKSNDMAVACVFDRDENFTFWRAQTDDGWCADCDTEPTHWMPLPEPPKEETE